MGANCLIFSTIETLQTRKTYINSGKSWLVQVNLTQSFPSPYFSFLWIYPMDYLHEFYSIYTIIITYDIRKTVLLTCINYVCNQYCCSKKDTVFWPNKGPSIACPYFVHFLNFFIQYKRIFKHTCEDSCKYPIFKSV